MNLVNTAKCNKALHSCANLVCLCFKLVLTQSACSIIGWIRLWIEAAVDSLASRKMKQFINDLKILVDQCQMAADRYQVFLRSLSIVVLPDKTSLKCCTTATGRERIKTTATDQQPS